MRPYRSNGNPRHFSPRIYTYLLVFFFNHEWARMHTILKRLENAEMLTVRTAEHGGRLRKYYSITAEGRKRIEDFKKEWEEMASICRFIMREDENE